MIKASELRIGNWLSYKGKCYQIYDGIRSLSIDDLDSEKLDSHLKNIKLSEVEPIPLTEEILLKCGFEKVEDTTYYIEYRIDNNYTIQYDKEDKFFTVFNRLCSLIEVNNLHQLQNLFYALTNEELQINL